MYCLKEICHPIFPDSIQVGQWRVGTRDSRTNKAVVTSKVFMVEQKGAYV